MSVKGGSLTPVASPAQDGTKKRRRGRASISTSTRSRSCSTERGNGRLEARPPDVLPGAEGGARRASGNRASPSPRSDPHSSFRLELHAAHRLRTTGAKKGTVVERALRRAGAPRRWGAVASSSCSAARPKPIPEADRRRRARSARRAGEVRVVPNATGRFVKSRGDKLVTFLRLTPVRTSNTRRSSSLRITGRS